METRNLFVYEIKGQWSDDEMAMRPGDDPMDGPRATGKHLQITQKLLVVAPNEEVAREALEMNFYAREHIILLECTLLGPLRCLVNITTDRHA